ncbi:MAG: hypothetical protein ACREN8_01700 [Candidatus Dormibacteraceae bacterium]
MPPGPATAQLVSGGGHITPALLKTLPAAVRDGYMDSFATSLHTVFLAAIPFVVIAFVLAWLLPEVALRSAAPPLEGVAESFGMVRTDAAEVQEEAWARVRAVQTALDRLDEFARRGGLAPELTQPLRRLFEARIAYFTERAQLRSNLAEEISPRGWRLVADVLQTERQAFAAPAVTRTLQTDDPHAVRQFSAEAATRRQAAQAALARLDELAPKSRVPGEQIDLLRSLFQARIDRVEKTVQAARTDIIPGSAHQPPAAFWQVTAELLAVERRALAEQVTNAELSRVVAERADQAVAEEQQTLNR